MEHQGKHVTFLHLNIDTEEYIFVHKLFYKRDEFPFFYCLLASRNIL